MRKCMLTNKTKLNGSQISHSNIKTKRNRHINIQCKKMFDIKTKTWRKFKITARGIRSFYKIIYKKKHI